MTEQYCPICNFIGQQNPRYPRYVCRECVSKASSADGRALEFYNIDLFGGFAARYAETEKDYPSHECFIEGIKCYADEARFGGIVIQLVE